jgi:hypothetical protein
MKGYIRRCHFRYFFCCNRLIDNYIPTPFKFTSFFLILTPFILLMCYRTFLSQPRSFLRVNTMWEVPERSRSAATVYSRTHLLCVFVYLLLLLTVVYHGLWTSLELQFAYSLWRSQRESVPRWLLHSPNKYPPIYRNDPIGPNSNLEFPIGRI